MVLHRKAPECENYNGYKFVVLDPLERVKSLGTRLDPSWRSSLTSNSEVAEVCHVPTSSDSARLNLKQACALSVSDVDVAFHVHDRVSPAGHGLTVGRAGELAVGFGAGHGQT
jgi:hypothetical protein